MTEPAHIVAGDSVSWSRSWSQYPSPTWTLTYYFASPTHALAPVVAAADGNGGHAVTLAPAVTATWAVDTYTWQAKVTDGADVHTVLDGRMDVAASLTTLDRYDSRAWVEKTLREIESAMLRKASGDQASYSIGGRSASRYSVEELTTWRDKLRAELTRLKRAERIARGEGLGGRILVRL